MHIRDFRAGERSFQDTLFCKQAANKLFLSFAFPGQHSHLRTDSLLLVGTLRTRTIATNPYIGHVCPLNEGLKKECKR